MTRRTSLFTFFPSAIKTASFSSLYLNNPSYTKAWLVGNVSAVSGTSPTLAFSIRLYGSSVNLQIQPDITATGDFVYTFTLPPGRWLIRCEIGGTTPSFTFSADLWLEGEETSLQHAELNV